VAAALLAGPARAQAPTAPAPPTAVPGGPAAGVPAASVPALAATKYTLANGLEVILHEDHSAPVVAVNTYFKVGSADEQRGRTGFAHLFEHIMFMGSQHVPVGAFDQLLEAAGASTTARPAPTARTTTRRCRATRCRWRCGSTATAWASCCRRWTSGSSTCSATW
jgi:hypothetical protein